MSDDTTRDAVAAELDAVAALRMARNAETRASARAVEVAQRRREIMRELDAASDAARAGVELATERRHAAELALGAIVNVRRAAARTLAAPDRHEYESSRGAPEAVTPCAVCGLSRRSAVHS